MILRLGILVLILTSEVLSAGRKAPSKESDADQSDRKISKVIDSFKDTNELFD